MARVTDFPARGKVTEVREGFVVFRPTGTNYELHLENVGGAYKGPVGAPVEATISVQARKLWTVPSGGNFVSPILGTPRIIQGRVRYADQRQLVVQAGTFFVVNLPADDSALDLSRGQVGVGKLVNVAALPGATFELLTQAALR